jgi:two-component system phosphate regulon response regulator PhoB
MSGSDERRIVVIEDEDAIRDVIAYNLERAGYRVAAAADGRAGLEQVRAEPTDLVLLDIMLPELDGLAVCRELRAEPATELVPVIMLTAKGDEDDVVAGLGAGADDYVTKPFSPRELVARVDAMLRRAARAGASGAQAGDEELEADRELAADPDRRRVEVDGVVVDPDRHEVLVDGEPVRLTRTELRLLHVLLRRPGRVYTREQLVERVMGDNAWITDRTIDVHVRAIRRKLDARADVIETIRGVGYRGRDAARA